MQLAVAEQPLAAPRCRGGVPAERSAHRHPVRVGDVEHRAVERARDRAAPEVRGPEAQPLLVGEPEHVEREREPDVLGPQPRHGRHGGEHAERPVERAGVAHRVEVGAEQQRARVRVRAGQVADEVAGGVDPDGHPGLPHPAADERVGALHRRASEAAREPALLVADPRELATARDDLRREVVHGAQLPRYVLYAHGATSSGTWWCASASLTPKRTGTTPRNGGSASRPK